MSKFLIRTVETYRCDTEAEAKQLIEDAKKDRNYTLLKYSSEQKCTKSKGEVVDEWVRTTLTKLFTDEKEPYATVSVEYKVEEGAFPSPVIETEEDDNKGIEF